MQICYVASLQDKDNTCGHHNHYVLKLNVRLMTIIPMYNHIIPIYFVVFETSVTHNNILCNSIKLLSLTEIYYSYKL